MYLVSGNFDLKSQVMRKPALNVGGQQIEIKVSFIKGCENLHREDGWPYCAISDNESSSMSSVNHNTLTMKARKCMYCNLENF